MTIAVANTGNTHTFEYWVTRTNEIADALSNKVITVDSNNTTGNATVNGYFSANVLTANVGIRGGNVGTANTLNMLSNLSFDTNHLKFGNSTVNVIVNNTVLWIQNTTFYSYISSGEGSFGNNTFYVYATPTFLEIANTAGNVHITAAEVAINNSAGRFFVGNSTVNVTINSSSLAVGGTDVLGSLPLSINVQTSGTSAQLVDSFDKTVYRGAEYVLVIRSNTVNAYHISKTLLVHNTGDAHITEYGVTFTNTDLGSMTANANSTHCRLYVTPTDTNTQVKGLRSSIVI